MSSSNKWPYYPLFTPSNMSSVSRQGPDSGVASGVFSQTHVEQQRVCFQVSQLQQRPRPLPLPLSRICHSVLDCRTAPLPRMQRYDDSFLHFPLPLLAKAAARALAGSPSTSCTHRATNRHTLLRKQSRSLKSLTSVRTSSKASHAKADSKTSLERWLFESLLCLR